MFDVCSRYYNHVDKSILQSSRVTSNLRDSLSVSTGCNTITDITLKAGFNKLKYLDMCLGSGLGSDATATSAYGGGTESTRCGLGANPTFFDNSRVVDAARAPTQQTVHLHP